MFKIYDLETAKNTILKRIPLTIKDYPPHLVTSVEKTFGEGTTLPGAVTKVLDSVRLEGDAALLKWSKLLDNADLKDLRIPEEKIKSAFELIEPSLRESLTLAAPRWRKRSARPACRRSVKPTSCRISRPEYSTSLRRAASGSCRPTPSCSAGPRGASGSPPSSG